MLHGVLTRVAIGVLLLQALQIVAVDQVVAVQALESRVPPVRLAFVATVLWPLQECREPPGGRSVVFG